MTISATNPQTLEHKATVADPLSPPSDWQLHRLSLWPYSLSSSAVQVKRHHRIWVAFIFSVQNKAKGHPQRCLKQPHYFGHKKLPKCGTAETTHLDPKTKVRIRETLVHLEIAHSQLASTWSIPNQHVSKRQHPSIHSLSAPKLAAELHSLLPEGN